MMVTKFEKMQKYLKDEWDFSLVKNTKRGIPWSPGSWTTGYTITGNLRGTFSHRYSTLKEIEKMIDSLEDGLNMDREKRGW